MVKIDISWCCGDSRLLSVHDSYGRFSNWSMQNIPEDFNVSNAVAASHLITFVKGIHEPKKLQNASSVTPQHSANEAPNKLQNARGRF